MKMPLPVFEAFGMDVTAFQQSVETPSTRRQLARRLTPYLLIAPTLFFVLIFTLYPAAQALIASLHRPARRSSDPAIFVGFNNFVELFDASHFIGGDFTRVLGNTLFFVTITVVISVPLALVFALLLNRKIRGLGLLRFSIVYPALLPMIGAASLWAFIFADTIGLAAVVLSSFGLANPNWLGDPRLALLSVTLVNIWKQASFYFIFYLAGLQAIPQDVYEAAGLDGANDWQQLRSITLPLLRRTTLFITIVSVTMAFQTVEHLPALGQGGPGVSSNLILYYIFQKIPERLNWGYVNAMTVVLVGMLLVFTVGNLVWSERGRDDERA